MVLFPRGPENEARIRSCQTHRAVYLSAAWHAGSESAHKSRIAQFAALSRDVKHYFVFCRRGSAIPGPPVAPRPLPFPPPLAAPTRITAMLYIKLATAMSNANDFSFYDKLMVIEWAVDGPSLKSHRHAQAVV